MKKTISIILTMIMLFSFSYAYADLPDISNLTYEELVKLKDQINLAIWNSEEWQEVTVPQGVWKIGEDIPEGHWSIRMAENNKSGNWCAITYCSKLDATGKGGDWSGIYLYQQLARPGSTYNAPEVYDIELKSGMYIIVEQKDVVFSPYEGKPSLGFK